MPRSWAFREQPCELQCAHTVAKLPPTIFVPSHELKAQEIHQHCPSLEHASESHWCRLGALFTAALTEAFLWLAALAHRLLVALPLG